MHLQIPYIEEYSQVYSFSARSYCAYMYASIYLFMYVYMWSMGRASTFIYYTQYCVCLLIAANGSMFMNS